MSSNDSVKVLHVLTRFLKWGGAEKNTTIAMDALREAGLDVELAVGYQSSSDAVSKVSDVNVQWLEYLDNSLNPLRNVQAVFELYRLIKQQNYDVVHTHQSKPGIIARIAAVMAGTPVVIYGLHSDYLSHPRLNSLIRGTILTLEYFINPFTDYYVSVGEEVKRAYLKRCLGSEKNHRVIRSGMDVSAFQKAYRNSDDHCESVRDELNLSRDELLLGKVASLESRKGHDDAIKVIERLRSNESTSNFKVLFVGEGHHREVLEDLVHEKDLEDNVIFLGYRDDVARIMSALDIFLFTSHNEGLPQVLVQAALTGTPIVTFDVEGVTEVIDHGETGFIVEERNISDMVQRVQKLMREADLRESMGRRGHEKVGNEWSLDRMKRNVKEFYNEVMADHNLGEPGPVSQ